VAESSPEDESTTDEEPRKPRHVYFGVTLIVASGILWFSLFAIPFLRLTLSQKAALGSGIFVGVQISWWTGAALAGPTVVRNLTRWFTRSNKRPP
jgi:hypothetical protein